VPLDPPDRLLLCLERRSQQELDVAAAGVQRLLQHADGAIPTPPLPPEALRLDGWPREALEQLSQGPPPVLSRAFGSSKAMLAGGAVPGTAPADAEGAERAEVTEAELPPAKQRRVLAGEGGGS
jgi:hypothetical protein